MSFIKIGCTRGHQPIKQLHIDYVKYTMLNSDHFRLNQFKKVEYRPMAKTNFDE